MAKKIPKGRMIIPRRLQAAESQAQLRAVLFDVDDTLLDWGARIVPAGYHRLTHLSRVYHYVRNEVHPLTISEEQFNQAAMSYFELYWKQGKQGNGAPHVGRVLTETLVSFGVPHERIDHRKLMIVYDWDLADGVMPFPDVFEVLPTLRAAGIKTGLITNSANAMWMRDVELSAAGLLEFFPDCRLSAADVGWMKPYPAIFKRALDCLGIAPEEAVFVGDEPLADVVGAQGVGMRAVLRVHPESDREEYQMNLEGFSVTPNAIIHTLHELLPLLDNWYPTWRNGG